MERRAVLRCDCAADASGMCASPNARSSAQSCAMLTAQCTSPWVHVALMSPWR